MIDALSARLGLAQAQDRQNPYRTMSLIDMARASLSERGVGMASFGSKMQLVGAAFTHTTSDFGHVLMSVSGKAMLRGWENSGETFMRWTKKGELTNFHTAHRVGISGFPALPKIPEAPSTSTSPAAIAAPPSRWRPTAACSASPARRSSTTT